jgi:ligand-binding SRPBCC domain-containing protein
MLPMFKLSAAGPLGTGRQWMSWIHLDDIVGAVPARAGPCAIGHARGRRAAAGDQPSVHPVTVPSLGVAQNLPAPALAIQALFGERAAVVLGSTRVEPMATQASGFSFRFETRSRPRSTTCWRRLRGGHSVHVWEQWLPHAAEHVWPFFGDANNLESITPPFLAFRVLGLSTPEIGAGTLIDYRLKLNGIPFSWQTRIDTWDPPRRFIDLQAKGPYTLWHHTHDFMPLAGGTLMRDTVRYRLPGGWFGAALGGFKVDADVGRIFAFRARAVDERFGR